MIEEALAIGALVILGTVGLLIVIGIVKLITHGLPLPLKAQRYEAGNPPMGRARGWFDIQYYGFVILFLAFEPMLILLFFLPFASHSLRIMVLILSILLFSIYIPPFIFGMKQVEDIRLWTYRERGS